MILRLYVESSVGRHEAGINRSQELGGSDLLKLAALLQDDHLSILGSDKDPALDHQGGAPDPAQGVVDPDGLAGPGINTVHLPCKVSHVDQAVLD